MDSKALAHMAEARRLVAALVTEMADLQREIDTIRYLAKAPETQLLSESIRDTELPTKVKGALINDGILTVADLVQRKPRYLETIPCFGKSGLEAIRWYLGLRGLYLGMDIGAKDK